jgi:hypothetical protein
VHAGFCTFLQSCDYGLNKFCCLINDLLLPVRAMCKHPFVKSNAPDNGFVSKGVAS